MSLALERLVGEHLLQRSGAGRLQAVHRLRSAALFDAIHNVPPPTREASITAAISAIDQHDIQPFMLGVLVDRPELTASVLDAVAQRLSAKPDALVAAGALHACRLVDFRREANYWLNRFDAHAVPYARGPSLRTSRFSAAHSKASRNCSNPVSPPQSATSQVITSNPALATSSRHATRNAIVTALTDCDDLEHAARLFASLAGNPSVAEALSDDQWIRGTRLGATVSDAPIEALARLIPSAIHVCAEAGDAVLQAAGGRDLVVRRIAQAHPWLRDFQVGTLAETIDDDTEHDLSPTALVAHGTYHYVSDLLVGDVRTECVAIATQLFAVIPDLEMARLICLDARGEPYGLPGFEMANLWLRKRYFPSTDEVAWNRARLRIIEALLVTGTHTDRVAAELRLLSDLATFVDDLAMHWVRSDITRGKLAKLNDTRDDLIGRLDALPPPPFDDGRNVSPLDEGLLPDNDPVDLLVRAVAMHIVTAIAPDDGGYGRLAALLSNSVPAHVAAATAAERWHLFGLDGPPPSLQRVAVALDDMHAVVCELAFGDSRTDAISRAATYQPDRRRALAKAASLARNLAEQRLSEQINAMLADTNIDRRRVDVVRRAASNPNTLAWPIVDLLFLFEVERIDDWNRDIVPPLLAARQAVSELIDVEAVPVRRETIIPASAVKITSERVHPSELVPNEWPLENRRVLAGGLAARFQQLLGRIFALSSIAVIPGERSDAEQATTNRLSAELEHHANDLTTLANDRGGERLVAEVGHLVVQLAGRVEDELNGRSTAPNLAAQYLEMLHGDTPTSDVTPVFGASLILTEFDIDPSTAQAWLNE